MKNIYLKQSLLCFAAVLLFTTAKAQFNYLPKSTDRCQIVNREHYTFSYNEEWEQASWVAYEVTMHSISGTAKRPSGFKSDPLVKTGSAKSQDYLKSGYDRGHLLPAAAMKMNQKAMTETFFMSNISPQAPYFNRGIWKKLESKVRDWAGKHKSLYVVTGPIVQKPFKTIGTSKVAVPQKFYKVIYNPQNQQAIAFILENKKSSDELSSFATSVDEAERLTGIDFFHALPDELETNVEKTVNVKKWF